MPACLRIPSVMTARVSFSVSGLSLIVHPFLEMLTLLLREERTSGACCKPNPSTMIGQSATPSCRTQRFTMPSALMFCTSSTATTSALPSHKPFAADASSSSGSCPVWRAMSRLALPFPPARPAMLTVTAPPVSFVSSAAISRKAASSPSARPMARNTFTWSLKEIVLRSSTRTSTASSRRRASSTNFLPSCVLPMPGTPVTRAIPSPRSRVLHRMSSRSCSVVSSFALPAKWNGRPHSPGRDRRLAGVIVSDHTPPAAVPEGRAIPARRPGTRRSADFLVSSASNMSGRPAPT